MLYVMFVRCPTVEIVWEFVSVDSRVLPRRCALNSNCSSTFSYSFGKHELKPLASEEILLLKFHM
jgi:hypothetical protein